MLSASIMSKQRRLAPEFDQALIWIVTALLAVGLVMVYSASIAIAETIRGQSTYFLIRHGLFIVAGLLAGVLVFQVPVQTWQKLAPYLFGLGVLMLVLVLVPFIGREINGSRRWLPLLIVNLQPSELMKLFVVIYAADYTVRKGMLKHHLFKAFWPMFLVMALVGFLLLLEPDMGGFVVICVIALSILFLGGFNLKVFGGLMVALPIAFTALIKYSPYRMERIIGFLDPWADPFGKGYQLTHSLIAFGRGEWLGVGLGASVEKLFYLPEAYSDFLLAVIAEELGVVGVVAIIALFVGLVMRAFVIGRQSAFLGRPFAALLAQGIGMWLGIQAMINMGVNMGVLPPKGLTLPFLSFGGSSMVANCIAIAILLRVDFENRMMMRGQTV